MVAIVGVGAAALILRDPHGNLAKLAMSKAHYFLGSLVSVKHLALNTVAKLKDPELKIKYPLSFQEVSFSGSRIEKSGDLVSWIAPFSDRVKKDEEPPRSKIRGAGKSRPVSLIGLKGETLSFQLILRSADAMDHLHVTIEPGPEASCLTFHRFKEIYLKVVVNWDGTLHKFVNPDPLIPFTDPYTPGHRLISGISLSEDKNQPLWFDVHLSDTCQGGRLHRHPSGRA